MKVYYQGISLRNLRKIKDRYKNLMPEVETGVTEIIEFRKDSVEAQWIIDNILPDVEKYTGRKHQFHRAVIFGQGPNSHPIEHVDGFWPPKPDAIIWSLNIPIKNCEKGEMVWWGGKFDVSTISNAPDYDNGFKPETRTDVKKLNSLQLTWHGDKHLIDRVVVDEPTIVKVDIPHQVINSSNKVRMLLAVRFTPDLII
jgi:hypothetical protein